ncbi:ATP-binding protein [Meridianimaribacter flavus]|uniref:ATPase AAA-type core domain-containing protein n=1 Tax=Meridianimaribacter flavus TaxID=571115 RepID=A0ABY2G8L6_9FLAO|nr:ATP-binding protein [Meridianimaribacter flavus]TDY14151.1 hypothetical protein A8975_0753 [Meridianimaribacter flavus]
MRLAAVYILEHYLFDGPQTINLIGKYFYSFEKKEKEIVINRVKNKNYVERLHEYRITEFSAIVGANGSGKTTLFSIINKFNDYTKSVFIYENEEDELTIENRTGKVNEHGNISDLDNYKIYFENNKLETIVNVDIPILYYSPIADSDLSRFSSPISKTTHFKSTLAEYYLDNVERSLLLLTDEVVNEIKSVYPQLPLYDYLRVFAKPLNKRDLRNTYGGFENEGDIEKIQKSSLDKLWNEYPNKDKVHLLHESKDFFKDLEVNIFSYLIIDGTSIQTAFNGVYEVPFDDIIKEKDFFKKLDHFFFHKLAYIDKYIYKELRKNYNDNYYHNLLYVFEETNFDGELKKKKDKILLIISELKDKSSSFKSQGLIDYVSNSLDSLIEKDLIGEEFTNISHNLTNYIDHMFNKYDVKDSDLGKMIESDLTKIEEGINKSFDEIFEARFEIIDQLKSGAKRAIRLFDSIINLYSSLQSIIDKEGFKLGEGVLNVDLQVVDFEGFKEVMQLYKRVIQELNTNSVIDAQLLEFRPNKRLSFGEKSLINLFSSLYEFTIKKHHHMRRKEHYILLLDEADLGFHPLWKKGFVSVIAKVTPLILQKLNDDIDNSKNPNLNNRKIQVIISTHDCLTLSDIPNYNITYIERENDGTTDNIRILSQKEKPTKSFGANITDLLADSFFIGDGLVGDFARDKIEEVINWLNSEKLDDVVTLEFAEKVKTIIEIIDEPILKTKLLEMYGEKTGENVRDKILDEQIAYLKSLKSDKH